MWYIARYWVPDGNGGFRDPSLTDPVANTFDTPEAAFAIASQYGGFVEPVVG